MAIICGTDFSESVAGAATGAAAIAGRFREPLYLVHVLDRAAEELDPGGQQALREFAKKRLAREAARVRGLTAAAVEEVITMGDPDVALIECAEAKKARLMVVSSAGHRFSPLFRSEGTSERLARGARIPLLVVRDPEPIAAWAKGARPLRVVVGIDESASSESAIQWVKALRQAGPCDVVFGHVYFADEASQRYGVRVGRSGADPELRLEQMIARDLAARVGDLPGTGEVTFRPRLGVGRVADHLLALAESERADLVVVGTSRRRGPARLWSVSSAVLHLARMAVALIPEDLEEAPRLADLPRIRRVLIATDLSPVSIRAIPHGYSLVREGGGEVYLLHVLLTAPLTGELLAPSQPGLDLSGLSGAQVDTEIAARLRALVPEAAERHGIVTRTEVVRGPDPAPLIVTTAERVGADVVCVASHGRKGLSRAVLGSVAEEVLRQSRRPVLILRPQG